ncbi:EAL domain-containing protein [Lederbergia wuyishanensis]|uniref:Diguanylate cyclase (GGDEF)-like protein/PAS domain S-box-containing protein n=1 Tax=Lederbergia wuyishanensis TaxID=1347903 RepID=A0ABU0D9Q8_9BACI|nr:diguanylate cyclase (GGDEF)-like protein/PAS domain S-box-containing protein [Lederbergia wuyishanensis]
MKAQVEEIDCHDLFDTDEKLETLLNTFPDLIIIKDGQDRWINANQYAYSLFGLEESQYLGKTSIEIARIKSKFSELFFSRYEYDQSVWKLQVLDRSEISFISHDGKKVTLDLISKPIFHSDGRKKALIIIGRDITDRIQMEKNNYYLAFYDQLTKLPNRFKFEEELENNVIISNALQQKFVVMYIGLDRFKNINDTLGPAIGDQLLMQISNRLQECIQEDWFLARIGGDEFSILIPNTRLENSISVAHKIIESIGVPFFINEYELFITASIGLCNFPEDGEDTQALMKSADIALNLAKEDGKNQYKAYSSIRDIKTFKAFSIENSLHKAMGMEEFELYYQPKIDIHTNRIVGAEALIRWNHPVWDLVSPNEFITLAEDAGLIIPIGKWVKETACKQNKKWQEEGLNIVPIAVNISAKRFMQKEFVKNIEKILLENQLDTQYLEIEITETSLMENEELAVDVIHQLSDLGLKVSLDDFGTGYSALSYLKQFKVDTIKIDRAFIKEIGENKQDELVVKGIINLIQSLNINVIAEGVETEEQLRFLRDLKCNQVQGYLYSRPVKAAEFKELLKKGKIKINAQTSKLNKEIENRRKFFRLNLVHPLLADMTIIKFMGRDVTLGKTEVLIQDVSIGGLSFISDIKMAVRPDMIISMETEILGENIEFIGKLVWMKELNDDVYSYGMEFIIEEKDRDIIAKLVNTLTVKIRKNPIVPDCRFIITDIYTFFKKH